METFEALAQMAPRGHEVTQWKLFLVMETFADSTGRMSGAVETHGAMETFPCPLHCTEQCKFAVKTSELTVNKT